MIKSALGVGIPSVLNLLFVVMFVRQLGESPYEKYVYLTSIISLPNALIFQPFIARIKARLIQYEHLVYGLYLCYLFIAFIAALTSKFYFSLCESIFISSYVLVFSIISLEKTISNISDKKDWIIFQILLPSVMVLIMVMQPLLHFEYDGVLWSSIGFNVGTVMLLLRKRSRSYFNSKNRSLRPLILGSMDSKLTYLIVAGVAVFLSTNFFKILVYNKISDEGVLFNYDLLQKLSMMFSSVFLVQYSRYAFRIKSSPSKIILYYFVLAAAFIVVSVFSLDTMLYFIFDIEYTSVTKVEMAIVLINLLLVGLMPIVDTYLNSTGSYMAILKLYCLYLVSLVLFYQVGDLISNSLLFNYQIASIAACVVALSLSYYDFRSISS